MKSPSAPFVAALFLFVGPIFAQEDADPPPYGHSQHGEAFNVGPRQAAVLIPGTGQVHFQISTKVEQAQVFFDQGLGQLHGFWDFEAERSFRQVAALDPDCAMAFWGMTMANFGNAKRAKEFIAQAKRRLENAGEREKMWIEAFAKYFENEKTDDKRRRRDLVRALEDIVLAYPDDVEAKAFLLKQIYQNSGKGNPISSHLTTNLLAGEILRQSPNHPAHHYRIHLWDREKPERALESSAKCGQAAPGIAHMWHMPGHIYSRLHRYADAVWQQEASARVDHAHMMRFRITPDRIHNFAHNNEWLIRNFNHLGQVERAVDLATNMIELPRLAKLSGETYNHSGGSWNLGRQRLRDTMLRFEEWERLRQFGESEYLKAGPNTIDEVEWRRIMGIAAFESGDRGRGMELLAEVTAELAKIEADRDKAAKDAETKNADKTEAQRKKAIEAAKRNFKSKIDSREKVRTELHAYELVTADAPDAEETGKALDAAKTMGKSRKARLFAKLGNLENALKLASEDVAASTNQVYPLAVQAWLSWQAGKPKEAEAAFEKLRGVGHVADASHPVFARLEPIARAMGIEGDWRRSQPPAKDLGKRPNLDSLGPFRWRPPAAPKWTMPNAENQQIALESFSGKPLVMIFYLGRGCTHCMDQLNKFAPFHEKFADAGIELIAVSTDTAEGLRETFAEGEAGSQNPFPFPLLSDSGLTTFRDYRAYDDFEKMALHGTYLIDEIGRIRWQEISYEPFMHPAFLLEECQRLLSFRESS